MLEFIVPRKVSEGVKTELFHILCKQKPAILLASIVIAFVSVAIFWEVVEQKMMLLWFFIIIGITALRMLLPKLIKKRTLGEEWIKTNLLFTFITGLSWGMLAFFFDPMWASHYQVSLFVIFVGIVCAAFLSNSSVFIAFPLFMFPVMFCLIYVMWQLESEGYKKIIFLIIAYMIVMYTAALRYHGQLVNLLEARFANEKLSDLLIESNLKLESLADTDALTNLLNRRSLDKILSAEWNRHCRNNKPLSFLFIDIDYFKQYNDSYGHDEGDKCLTRVANVIKENARRSSDIVARYGGEEFSVVLPETSEHDSTIVAENIRTALLALKIPHKGSAISEYVTMSIGISSITPDQNNNEDILRIFADKALYQAKKNGRNQCVVSNQDSIES